MMLSLNRELVSRVKLCLVSVFPDPINDCPKIRNLPKIFLRSFENGMWPLVSFVLLCFPLFAFFWVVFSFFIICIFIVFCPVFSSLNQREWHSVA